MTPKHVEAILKCVCMKGAFVGVMYEMFNYVRFVRLLIILYCAANLLNTQEL